MASSGNLAQGFASRLTISVSLAASRRVRNLAEPWRLASSGRSRIQQIVRAVQAPSRVMHGWIRYFRIEKAHTSVYSRARAKAPETSTPDRHHGTATADPNQRSAASCPPQRSTPLSVDCVICHNKMVLIAVERRPRQTAYTYRCVNEHLQELSIANTDGFN